MGSQTSMSFGSSSYKEKSSDCLSENVSTNFTYDLPANYVEISGSFCNWSEKFMMQKNDKGTFVLNLKLPKGIHRFKFKVDGEWKINKKLPSIEEKGYVNNFIDTNFFLEKISTCTGKAKDSCKKSICKSYIKRDGSEVDLSKAKKNYTNYYPKEDEMSGIVPNPICFYQASYCVSDIRCNIRTKKLKALQHVLLNHCFFANKKSDINDKLIKSKSMNDIKNINNDIKNFVKNDSADNVNNECSINKLRNFYLDGTVDGNKSSKIFKCLEVSRFRFKQATFVYYKPI